jgi:hypothetical protein
VRAIAIMWLVGFVACGAAPVRPTRLPVPEDVGSLVVDDSAFTSFSSGLARDVDVGLVQTPNDKDRLFIRAMLAALGDHWDAAVADLDRIRTVETDPRAKVMTGLTIRIWADAIGHGGDTPGSFRAALERTVATLPVALVYDDLAELRAMGHTFTPEVCRSLVGAAVRPVRGTIPFDDAQTIVFQRYAVKRLVAVGAILDEVLAAHGIELPTE